MRIAELSARSGVPVPTIKYYVREGLLPSGRLTSPNQAQYDESHLRRLKLIRALVDVGKLSIAAAHEVLSSIDAPELTLHEQLGKAQYATTPRRERDVDDAWWQEAARRVGALIDARDWRVTPVHPARQTLTELVATLLELGQDDLVAMLDVYAAAAERIAEVDVRTILRRSEVESMLEGVVIGTVLGDGLLAALRRLAQANVSARITPETPPREPA